MKKPTMVVMLPTEDKFNSAIMIGVTPGVMRATQDEDVINDIHDWMKFGKPQHVYITVSQDIEPIKEGDWVICSDYKNSHQTLGKVSHIGEPFNFKNTIQINGNPDLHIGRHILDYCRKIIATDDPKLTIFNTINDKTLYIPQLQQSFLILMEGGVLSILKFILMHQIRALTMNSN